MGDKRVATTVDNNTRRAGFFGEVKRWFGMVFGWWNFEWVGKNKIWVPSPSRVSGVTPERTYRTRGAAPLAYAPWVTPLVKTPVKWAFWSLLGKNEGEEGEIMPGLARDMVERTLRGRPPRQGAV